MPDTCQSSEENWLDSSIHLCRTLASCSRTPTNARPGVTTIHPRRGRSSMSLSMSLEEFARRLRAMNCPGRPFVCEGSPLTCTAFIVGLNPTTPEFWKYWNDSYGFHKSAWLDDFRQRRGNRARARNIIETIVRCASPIRCLETNIYDVACRNSEDLRRLPKNTDVFRFLLETIKPTAPILHGRTDVHTEVGRILGVDRFSAAGLLPWSRMGEPSWSAQYLISLLERGHGHLLLVVSRLLALISAKLSTIHSRGRKHLACRTHPSIRTGWDT